MGYTSLGLTAAIISHATELQEKCIELSYTGINVINYGLSPVITGLNYPVSKILRFTGKSTERYIPML